MTFLPVSLLKGDRASMDQEAKRVKRVVREQERRRKLEKNTAEPWHSRSYQKEFEGFAERVVQTEKGRSKIERIYVGNYYELDASDSRRILLKWTHMVLAIAACVFFLMSAAAQVAANFVRLITFFQAVEILALACMLWLALKNLFTRPRMIIRQYKGTSKAILNWSRVTAVTAAVNGILSLIFTFVRHDETFREGLLVVLWYILSSVLMCFAYSIENAQTYRVIRNDTPITDDMTVIGNIEI